MNETTAPTDGTLRTTADLPSGRSTNGTRLAVLGSLARALETEESIERAGQQALRAICDVGPWSKGRFECARRGVQPVVCVHRMENEHSLKSVEPQTSRMIPNIGRQGAHLELHRAASTDCSPAAEAFVEVAAALLGRVVARIALAADRDKAEADRARRWALVKQSEDALREQYARLYTAINNMSQGLAMYDGDGKIVLCNDQYATMYGLTTADVRAGTPYIKIDAQRRLKGVEIKDCVEDEAFETDGALALKNESRTWRLGDGRRILASVQPLWNGGWVTTHEDTTERERFEERISHLAHHDALTDLANRVLFRERLDRALSDTNRGGDGFAVLWLDLDRFKIVNDTLGHIMGDLVLKAAAKRLRGCVRETDLVARLGGDEFAILQVPVRGIVDADRLALRVREVIAAPFVIEGQRISLETSIGICVAPDDTNDADQLLLNADTALYRAKGEGRGTHRFFKAGMDAAIQIRRQLEAKLRQALEDDAFELHYQPIVDLRTGDIVSCEALLRWSHPDLGQVSPNDFIPVAEEAGLMERLGRWLLTRACTDAAGWPSRSAVAVNISPSHVMSRNLTFDVVHALDVSGLRPDRLEVEITEAVLMQHTDEALQALNDLRTLGVKLAMDDFGTGYSSLAYLGRFPFSKIKIDRSFIAGLPEDRNSHAIVKAITGLSEGLGVITTAEGVETESQLTAVRAFGCTQVQGFLFCRPVRNDVLCRLFAERALDRPDMRLLWRDGFGAENPAYTSLAKAS